MKHIVSALLGFLCLLSTGIAGAADYVDLRRFDPVAGDAGAGAAKASTLCFACHGAAGISVVPIFPNLAGQRADYLYHELLRYKSGALPDSPMTALMATLDDTDMRNLAVHYASLPANTTAAPIADQAAFDRGATLYRDGDSARGVPPCQGCHGIDGAGLAGTMQPNQQAWPLLRHQKAAYLATRLTDYRNGKLRSHSNDFIMRSVAGRLDDAEIAALAAWLASAP